LIANGTQDLSPYNTLLKATVKYKVTE